MIVMWVCKECNSNIRLTYTENLKCSICGCKYTDEAIYDEEMNQIEIYPAEDFMEKLKYYVYHREILCKYRIIKRHE